MLVCGENVYWLAFFCLFVVVFYCYCFYFNTVGSHWVMLEVRLSWCCCIQVSIIYSNNERSSQCDRQSKAAGCQYGLMIQDSGTGEAAKKKVQCFPLTEQNMGSVCSFLSCIDNTCAYVADRETWCFNSAEVRMQPIKTALLVIRSEGHSSR